jgi:RNase H-like protein
MPVCQHCGSEDVIRRGYSKSGRLKIQCKGNCGLYSLVDDEDATSQNVYPNILLFDIETLPILAYTWGAWEQNINPIQVVKDWCILSYSAKWLGNPKIISDVLLPQEAINRDDSRLMKNLWELIDKANIIIGHNSKRFDIKKINTRFWKHHFPKPSSYRHIDTLTSAKEVFGLTYNKLDYIAEFIGIQRKLETDFQLWADCDMGNEQALQTMREYNERDSEIEEVIYLNMREWIPNHPNLSVYSTIKDVCPICLGTSYREIGLYTATKKQYPEYRCDSCKGIWHSNKSIK